MPPSQLMTDGEVMAEVRRLVSQGRIAFTDHVEQRMAQRGIGRDEVRACLATGHFFERPHVANRPGRVNYRFGMESVIDGDRIAVAAALDPEREVVVITTY